MNLCEVRTKAYLSSFCDSKLSVFKDSFEDFILGTENGKKPGRMISSNTLLVFDNIFSKLFTKDRTHMYTNEGVISFVIDRSS